MNKDNRLLKLIQHVKTHLNSVYYMFKRLSHLRWPVIVVLSDMLLRHLTKILSI